MKSDNLAYTITLTTMACAMLACDKEHSAQQSSSNAKSDKGNAVQADPRLKDAADAINSYLQAHALEIKDSWYSREPRPGGWPTEYFQWKNLNNPRTEVGQVTTADKLNTGLEYTVTFVFSSAAYRKGYGSPISWEGWNDGGGFSLEARLEQGQWRVSGHRPVERPEPAEVQ